MSLQTTDKTMINLTINGQAVSVPKGTTVYNAAKSLSIEIPVFCYHDRMPPFGACRVCLVEVEKMAKPQTSCTLEATEGMVIKTQSQLAVEGREGILEFLLINHPLDCPICDRGGECPLQDQTVKFGPGLSRFFEDKRRFKKPIPLGPVLMLDRERCITCARCTRFGDLVAGDHALEFIDRGYRTEVGTPGGGPADSKFIGNTIMICPVGALTSQVYRFRARPWDNMHTKSICTLCPVGCSLVFDSRDGEIMRTRSCENKDVNDIWLCDKGWFGYEFTYHGERLEKPLIRKNGKLTESSWDEALALIAEKIKVAKPQGRIAGFGGNPLTVEENYLFQKLIREGAGVNHVDHRIGSPILSSEEEGLPGGMELTIGECEKLDFALLLGTDLTEEFPVIWLRLKQAINKGAKVISIGHFAPEISQHLTEVITHKPGAELDILSKHLTKIEEYLNKEKVTIFIGSQYLNSPNRLKILNEILKLRLKQPNLTINILEGRGNSIGARFAGMHPEFTSGGKKSSNPGLNAIQILEKSGLEGWDVLYVAGADPASKYPNKLWNDARSKLDFLVVQDLFLTKTAEQADVVLPTRSYVEKEGHFINIEGRVQKLQPGKEIPKNIYSDGDIFTLLGLKLQGMPIIDKLFREKLEREKILDFSYQQKINSESPSSSANYSTEGKLVASFIPSLFDHGVRMKHNPHTIKLAKSPKIQLHPSEAIARGINSNDLLTITINDQMIKAHVELNPAVALETLLIPTGFEEIPIQEFGVNLKNGCNVEVRK